MWIWDNMGNMAKTGSNGLGFCPEYDPMFFMFQDMFLCWFVICIQVSCRLSTVLCGLGCVDLRCMFGFPSDWAFTFASCRTSCKSNLLASDMPLSYTMLIWSTPTCLWMTWGLFLVFLSLQSSIQVCGWVSHVFYWQGALQLFGGFQWSGVQPEVEQAAFWSNGACLQLPGCCSEWVDKSGDIAWECIDMWKIRFQNCTPCENTPNPKAYWCLQYSQLPYETTGRLGGQIQAHPNSKRKSEVYHV